MSLIDAVTIDRLRDAARRLRGIANRTPIHRSRWLNEQVGCEVFIKCESFQRVGAFKFRGAYNALSRLHPDSAGVLTYSSGNHAQSVALASATLGLRAVIIMPNNAPPIKRAATRGYLARAAPGSELVEYDPASTTRELLGREIAEREGLTVVPPYDHPDVIAGQGTAGLELLEDAGALDAIWVPCGGGGLVSGTAVAAAGVCPTCKIIGVEPELADDATRSFQTGRLQTVTNPPTIADGARTPYLGRYTFPLVVRYVSEMMTVREDEIASAALTFMERLKLVVEPTGALGLAGLLARAAAGELPYRRVGVIISGGNLDPAVVSDLIRLRNART
ncbi:MAG: pyridoxal-phosphate dependent enzyme [Planctomycetota bacterium]|nr:MAG: pyridoxal-phosphate dependent enzyme [Planctomycetota bacterium]